MKKIFVKFFAIVLICAGMFLLPACDSLSVNFTTSEIILQVGEEKNVYSYVKENITSEQKEQLSFATENSNVAVVTFDNKIVAVSAGSTTLNVLFSGNKIASAVITVQNPPIVLTTPTNLHFDETQGAITWNYVYYFENSTEKLFPYYKLEITKNNGTTEIKNITDANSYVISEAGNYKVRVKATTLNDSSAFTASAFSEYYNFQLTSAPTALNFDLSSKTLTWNANGNESGTKYIVKYTIASELEKTVTVSTTSCTFTDDFPAGTHTFTVTTVPKNDTYFKNTSSVLTIEKLNTPQNITFDNGRVTFASQTDAKKYCIIVEFDDSPIYAFDIDQSSEPVIITDVLKENCLTAGDYKFIVQAIGDEDSIFSSDASNEFLFKKLPKAEIVLDTTSNIFMITNATLGTGHLEVARNNDKKTAETTVYWGDVTTSVLAYAVSGQLMVNSENRSNQIDGEIATTFTILGDSTKTPLSYIQNLNAVLLQYSESEGNSIISFDELDENSQYELYSLKNTIETKLQDGSNNSFTLGATSSVFGDKGTYSYIVKIKKAVGDNTYFVPTQSEIEIEKLDAPTTLTSQNGKIAIQDTLLTGASKVEYKINNILTDIIDQTQTEWSVQTRFVATAIPTKISEESNLLHYYTSSNYTNFTLKRIDKVDATYDYQTRCFVFDDVANVKEYQISKSGVVTPQTFLPSATKKFDSVTGNYDGEYSIVSVTNTWDSITSTDIGYFNSLPFEITVYKVGDVSGLVLSKDEDENITLSWTSPENYGKTLNYAVYCRFTESENDDGQNAISNFTLVPNANELTATSYTFASDFFDDVGQYRFKVLVTNPVDEDKQFFTNEDSNVIISITRLVAPKVVSVVVNQNNVTSYTFTIDKTTFSAVENKLANIQIKRSEVDSNPTLQTSNNLQLTINNGDSVELRITYLGLFDATTGSYYLNSAESTFNVEKFSQVTSISLDSIDKTNKQYNFSWVSPDVSGGNVPSTMTFSCIINSSSNYSPNGTKLENVEYKQDADLHFSVKAIATNEWTDINASAKQYLACDTYTEYVVPKENAITNVQLAVENDGEKDVVILSWEYQQPTGYEINENYIPKFSCALGQTGGYTSNSNLLTFNPSTHQQTIITNPTSYRTTGNFYEKRYDFASFYDGEYTFSVSVDSAITIASDTKAVTITKLPTIDKIAVDDDEKFATFLNSSGEALSSYGVQKIVVASGTQLSQSDISGKTINLSNVTPGDCSVTVYQQAKASTENEGFFLDGDQTTFSFNKIEPTAISFDSTNRQLTWEARNVSKYKLTFANVTIIANATSKLLSDIELLISEAGDYEFKVKAWAEAGNNYEAGSTITLSSEFGSPYTLTKLAKVQNIQVATTDEEQEEVTISWTGLAKATDYEIYVSYNDGDYVNKVTVPNSQTSYLSNGWFTEVGTYKIKIIAKANDCLQSEMSSMPATVYHLDKISSMKISSDGTLNFVLPTNLQSLPSSYFAEYVIKIYDSENTLQFTGSSNEFSYNLLQCEFLTNLQYGYFNVSVQIIGTISSTAQTVATLTGETSDLLNAYKLKAPTISVENNKIIANDTNDAELTYDSVEVTPKTFLKVQDSSDLTNYLCNKLTSSYTISNYVSSYTVETYATVDAGIYNIINSNAVSDTISTLTTPTNFILTETNDVVSASWNDVLNAQYEIFVNNTKIAQTTSSPYEFNSSVFANTGKYSVKIRAISGNNLYSEFTSEITVVRLNALSGSYMLADKIVYISQPAQETNFYTIYLSLCNSLNEKQQEVANNLSYNATSYDGFGSWIDEADSGVFYVNVQAIGNGTSNDASSSGVLTLDSANTQISVYKLALPQVVFNPAYLEAVLSDSTNLLGSKTIESLAQVQYSIYSTYDAVAPENNVFALDENSNNIQNFTNAVYTYPNAWQAGTYTAVYQAVPKTNTRNVIASASATVSAERLEAPQSLGFQRSELTQEQIDTYYHYDGDTAPQFVNTLLNFTYDPVTNASFYLISNATRSYPYITATTVPMVMEGEFENLVYEGNVLNVIAVAANNSGYINSTTNSISYTYLPSVQNFTAVDGCVTWVANADAQTYLLYAMQTGLSTSKYHYWQAQDFNTTSSYLTGIIDGFEGDININIKAVGNVGTTKVTENIVLDSMYRTGGSASIAITKLSPITDLTIKNGFVSFTKTTITVDSQVQYVDTYSIDIYDEDDNRYNPQKTYLTSYANSLGVLPNDATFVGYCDALANLPTDEVFTIKVRAEKESTQDKKYLYSDLSNAIKVQVLDNVNEGAILSLSNASSGDLTKKCVICDVNKNASGVWVLHNDYYTAYDSSTVTVTAGTTNKFTFTPSLYTAGELVYSFASMGSSSPNDDDVYYLNSSFTSITTHALTTPTIAVENGILSWNEIEDADGYYVYIDGILFSVNNSEDFNGKIYKKHILDLPDSFGSDINSNITVSVVAITGEDDLSKIASPTASLKITHVIGNNTLNTNNFVVKLHTPENLTDVDGALIWNDGVVGLDDFNSETFTALFTTIINDLVNAEPSKPFATLKAEVDAIETYIASKLTSPITIFSPYTGFNDLTLTLTFTDSNGVKTTFEGVDAHKFLKLTSTQKSNLQSLVQILTEKTQIIIDGLETTTENTLYSTESQTFEDIKEYTLAKMNVLKSFVTDAEQVANLEALYDCVNNSGFPVMTLLFEEYDEISATMISGDYDLTITQYGNSFDWLTSTVSDTQEIYIPFAPSTIQIVKNTDSESDYFNNFYLEWSKVEVPANYSATYYDIYLGQNVTSTNAVYVLLGEDKTGVRHELLRTVGDSDNSNEILRINLTYLIEQDILTPDITSIFLVVSGNDSVAKDSTSLKIINGKKSTVFNISVLGQLSPSVVDGKLVMQRDVSALGVELVNNTNEVREVLLSNSSVCTWAGDNLAGGNVYNVSVRAVGSVFGSGETATYVLTGKTYTFNIGKLAIPEVSVNKFGVFTWSAVANTNTYVVTVNETENVITTNSYEANQVGYNNYKFMAFGTKNASIKSSSTTCFLNSGINKSGEGIDAVMLSSVENVYIEDGLIKWTALNLATTQNISTVQDGTQIVGYRLTLNDGQAPIYTTNNYFDLTGMGQAKDDYNVLVQAYIYFSYNEQEFVGKTLHDSDEYAQLLGVAFSKDFEKINAPTNIRIENGEFVWDGQTGDSSYFYEIYLNGTLLSPQATGSLASAIVWPGNDLSVDTQYNFRVKAFADGKVCSNFTTYATPAGAAIAFDKLAFSDQSYTSYKDAEGNHFSFEFGDQSFNYGFNIRYLINGEEEYKYLKVTDSNYSDIVTIEDGVVSVNVTKLDATATSMTITLQLVALGETNYISSDFKSEYDYSTPKALKEVLFDSETEEYYFTRINVDDEEITYGFMIQDEILDNSGNLLATYVFAVPSGTKNELKTSNFFDSKTNTVRYAPTVLGYNHRVSVSVTTDITSANAFMSPYTTSNVIYGNADFNVEGYELYAQNLFSCATDLFSESSPVLSETNQTTLINYLTSNAYGSVNNPYIIDSATAFENINKRLVKYSYQSTYKLEIEGSVCGQLAITDSLTTYVFKQTADLTNITTMIGKKALVNSAVQYTDFNGVYDGDNKSISYSIVYSSEFADTIDRTGLFRGIGKNGVVKNLQVDATFNFASLAWASFDVGCVASYNSGLIENVTITDVNVTEMVKDNIGLLSINFGGIVSYNNGTIISAFNKSASEISLEIATPSTSNTNAIICAGGIVAMNYGTIQSSLNQAHLNISSRYECYVGGIAGKNNATILASKNTGTIEAVCLNSSSNAYIGGIVGVNQTDGTITSSISSGEIIAINTNAVVNAIVYAGGIAGSSANFSINHCYSTVPEIVLEKDGLGQATNLGGTLVGTITAEWNNTSNINYYVNSVPFMNSMSYSTFAEQIDDENLTDLQTVVASSSQYFKISNGKVVLTWE